MRTVFASQEESPHRLGHFGPVLSSLVSGSLVPSFPRSLLPSFPPSATPGVAFRMALAQA